MRSKERREGREVEKKSKKFGGMLWYLFGFGSTPFILKCKRGNGRSVERVLLLLLRLALPSLPAFVPCDAMRCDAMQIRIRVNEVLSLLQCQQNNHHMDVKMDRSSLFAVGIEPPRVRVSEPFETSVLHGKEDGMECSQGRSIPSRGEGRAQWIRLSRPVYPSEGTKWRIKTERMMRPQN